MLARAVRQTWARRGLSAARRVPAPHQLDPGASHFPTPRPSALWRKAALVSLALWTTSTQRADAQAASAQPAARTESLASAISPAVWRQVESSVDRALAWLVSQQDADGSIYAPITAQPAATSFAVMAFLSKGHIPGEGPYGRQLDAMVDYVLACQQPNGLLAFGRGGSPVSGKTGNYNHGVAALMLTEVYGMTDRARGIRLKPAILSALEFTRSNQLEPKRDPQDAGGWRYLDGQNDSDLSVTSWQLMFLRSARNAEFDVPKPWVDDSIGYVLRCWDDRQGLFYYKKSGSQVRWSRGMVGAGILSLALAGQHNTRTAQRAGDWLLTHPFRAFGELIGGGDRFFYSTYYCSQAMAQLGGRHWKLFFPNLVNVFLRSQHPSGEWPAEPAGNDASFGNTYTTAMAVLSLTPPLQLLPVYQR